jgi:3',5'-cyclic AMP phosphodiesterase CpdA
LTATEAARYISLTNYARHEPSTRAVAQVALLLVMAVVLAGCAGSGAAPAPAPPAAWTTVRFAVLSDPHLYDTSISEPGMAFDSNLVKGSKLFVESARILEAAGAAIIAEKPAFLLVCGDLTKDGERASHELVVRELERLRLAGVPAYVVPGNHDILNPRAARYSGGSTAEVPSVSPAEFASLYGHFGYGSAIQRDPDSLSYVVEAAPGLWLLALDSCRHQDNRDSPVAGGRLLPSTSRWARGVLADGRRRGVRVIAMLHHAIMEQFRGQKTWMSDYVIDDHDAVARLLADGGVTLAFTGHTHAQNIARRSFPAPGGGTFIYDVGTGATVSWPSPWRLIEIDAAGSMRVSSRFVTDLPDFPGDFSRYSEDRLRQWVQASGEKTLRRFGASDRTAAALALQATDAVAAFYRGERPESVHGFRTGGLDLGGLLLAAMMDGAFRDFQTDLPPADNDVTLDLAAGR